MKAKLLALATCFLCLLLCVQAAPAGAESPPYAAAQAQDVADGILSFARGDATSTQEWLNSALCAQAGAGAEWYILCLAQSKEYDFSAYESALLEYLSQNNVASATTKQKYALVLAAIGSTDAYIAQVTEQTVGSLGIMSYVYGLHLLHNGYMGSISADEAIDAILSLQKSDGGWAITGNTSDVDVTAMTLQALAPYYEKREDVTASVNHAIAALSQRQQDNGGFVSYGVNNPESAAQVIVALCALGIDPVSDERFIKNGCSALDAIDTFALDDGSYCHQKDGAYSAGATAQVLCAATAYLRFANGEDALYSLDQARPEEVESPTTGAESESPTDQAPAQPSQEPFPYKPIASAVILVLGGIVCVLLIVLGKRHYKNFIALAIAVAILLAALWLIDIRLPEDYYNGQYAPKQDVIGEVTLTIRCDCVPGLDQIDHLPDDGILLENETIALSKGETAYDILIQAARAHGLHVDTTGAGESAYVRGICYLYEQQHGDLSGWTYKINGISPSTGCGAYTLSHGDTITFEYTLTLGNLQ